MRESDGDVWRYQGTGTFNLPDGTKITIQEKGDSKDLHINQVDIYNGNKHVSVDSQLTSAEWQTVSSKSERVSATPWRNLGTVEERQVTTRVTEQQEARQKFATTFSDVKKDGYAHDAATADGQSFQLAGDGIAWSQGGKEVQSGAGKGKDDKTLAFSSAARSWTACSASAPSRCPGTCTPRRWWTSPPRSSRPSTPPRPITGSSARTSSPPTSPSPTCP